MLYRVYRKDTTLLLLDRVAGFKQLKGGVEFIDKIPKSPSGKILRRLLRAKEAAKNA